MGKKAARLPTTVPPRHILLVDDESIVAQTVRLILKKSGYTVDWAEDGRQGLTMFLAERYDLVLSDFKMPGMDGLQLAEAIQAANPATPIIIITAYAQVIEANPTRTSNIKQILAKPFSVAELQAAISNALT